MNCGGLDVALAAVVIVDGDELATRAAAAAAEGNDSDDDVEDDLTDDEDKRELRWDGNDVISSLDRGGVSGLVQSLILFEPITPNCP